MAYIGLIGHAFLFGEVDSKALTKITSNKAAYVYPGFQVAIVGQFDKNVFISGQAAEVQRHKCENGIRFEDIFYQSVRFERLYRKLSRSQRKQLFCSESHLLMTD